MHKTGFINTSSGSTTKEVIAKKSATYREVIHLDTSSHVPLVFPGKSVVYSGIDIKTVEVKYQSEQEKRRNRILIRNGVIPSTPKTDAK